ncbi:aldehyde dehydrogenase (NAD+) [Paenochrobactrum gallinarii]|uniref:aldehyde dehydrogenase (NAD(+)) n=1 Tax=Paenochrobactrum gallinarii TaxID=643673 RepID=A0A841LW71_9HYPH|nr:aldehyde dehydrogenase family protein [Paenochrobactrum gallinarii]MBB6260737.1 aldehyde dehydrogenase (NAD+) [Paenochrobactrum gallinarii]
MQNSKKFYIDGAWVDPVVPATIDVIDPSTEQIFATISAGSKADADKAVAAAKAAFTSFSQTTKQERLELLKRILAAYNARTEEFGKVISQEMGAPLDMAISDQAGIGTGHLAQMIKTLEEFDFDYMQGQTKITHEPVGVVAMITPWNWPINQIASKVAPAIAAGCTMVLKPSEIAPLNAILFAEIMHEAGVPKGVFNLVNGDGPSVGQVLAEHKDVDMVSFTGSTRAGVIVAQSAAPTVKRVHQELGGKSPNIVLRSADLKKAIPAGVFHCFNNSGQSCNAPTRMYVPSEKMDEVIALAKVAAEKVRVGAPSDANTTMGPVVSEVQYNKIQELIQSGIDEGAELVTGGTGRPAELNSGYYVRPTVFARVQQDMRIAREEIFGPVLSILEYDTVENAIELANDTEYGLASYIQGDLEEARAIAPKLRTGTVRINRPDWDSAAPFGGYKQSGNGREYGLFGLMEFLEIKGILGYEEA